MEHGCILRLSRLASSHLEPRIQFFPPSIAHTEMSNNYSYTGLPVSTPNTKVVIAEDGLPMESSDAELVDPKAPELQNSSPPNLVRSSQLSVAQWRKLIFSS